MEILFGQDPLDHDEWECLLNHTPWLDSLRAAWGDDCEGTSSKTGDVDAEI